jgi:hypothetical protein
MFCMRIHVIRLIDVFFVCELQKMAFGLVQVALYKLICGDFNNLFSWFYFDLITIMIW